MATDVAAVSRDVGAPTHPIATLSSIKTDDSVNAITLDGALVHFLNRWTHATKTIGLPPRISRQ